MSDFGLKEDRLNKIRSALARYPQVNRAVIFGSRATGYFRHNSDIDLAVYIADSEDKMPGKLLLEIDDAAGIYKIDVIDMLRLNNEPLRQRIEEQGVEIYST
ncbi:MAG: nucleotidyltransferase domain-containing protein [Syntrophomonas sp.]|nr:nucleotidyltransferase domain-containing protein [Syntrophomonas sp.]